MSGAGPLEIPCPFCTFRVNKQTRDGGLPNAGTVAFAFDRMAEHVFEVHFEQRRYRLKRRSKVRPKDRRPVVDEGVSA